MFKVKSSERSHSVSLTAPSCSCEDWSIHGFPCKHMFANFRHAPWDSLPASYLSSSKLTLDLSLGNAEAQPQIVEEVKMLHNTGAAIAPGLGAVSDELQVHQTSQQRYQLYAKRLRNTLKVIEAQSFVCKDADALDCTNEQLETLSEHLARSCQLMSRLDHSRNFVIYLGRTAPSQASTP